jgi:tRNA A37 threonylcarbamoyladenosine dehydratase
MSDFGFRFGGIARLYGTAGLERLRRAHVMVVGIGGVGSWVVEALARSGVGRLSLVDLDEICVSNVNRQLHALDGTVGRPKVEVMAERALGISPTASVEAISEFFTADSANRLLGIGENGTDGRGKPDFVVDAIDSMSNKVRLIALCHAAKIPLIVCGGAGGRRDPTAVRTADVVAVTHDRLVSEVRKRLRKEHGFPRDGKKFGIECVYSAEPQVFPASDGSVCGTRESADGESLRLNCESGFGSATFVTGVFGFAAAARVVARLAT